MPRVSRKEADQHRKDVLRAASRLFLEHGIDGISVPAVMAEAGLTHGGFYGHFTSKEALVAEARRQGIDCLRLEASITAREFFAAHGFELLGSQLVEHLWGDQLVSLQSRPAMHDAVPYGQRGGVNMFADSRSQSGQGITLRLGDALALRQRFSIC